MYIYFASEYLATPWEYCYVIDGDNIMEIMKSHGYELVSPSVYKRGTDFLQVDRLRYTSVEELLDRLRDENQATFLKSLFKEYCEKFPVMREEAKMFKVRLSGAGESEEFAPCIEYLAFLHVMIEIGRAIDKEEFDRLFETYMNEEAPFRRLVIIPTLHFNRGLSTKPAARSLVNK